MVKEQKRITRAQYVWVALRPNDYATADVAVARSRQAALDSLRSRLCEGEDMQYCTVERVEVER